MKKTVNTRVSLLKNHFNLDSKQFVAKVNISPTTLWAIEKGGDCKPKTIKSIADAFNVNLKWLQEGEGEMFRTIVVEAVEKITPWREEAYNLLKDELKDWKAKHAEAMNMVSMLIQRVPMGKFNGYALTAKENKRAPLLRN